MRRVKVAKPQNSQVHKSVEGEVRGFNGASCILLALPITSCGLRLDEEAVRVAVGARLGLRLCVPHKCNCGAEVDAEACHALVCKKGPRPNGHCRHQLGFE